MTTLTELCHRHHMTLGELAERIGKSRDTVKKWGRERRIPAEAVPEIVRAFRGAVKPHELRPDVFAPRDRAA